MFSTNDFPDQPASRRGRRLRVAGGVVAAGSLVAGGLVVASNAGAADTVWDRVAACESTNNWSINTGNGYYGGLQFDNQTWLGSGGGAYAPRADLATREQQIAIANKVYAQRGLQPWACGHAA